MRSDPYGNQLPGSVNISSPLQEKPAGMNSDMRRSVDKVQTGRGIVAAGGGSITRAVGASPLSGNRQSIAGNAILGDYGTSPVKKVMPPSRDEMPLGLGDPQPSNQYRDMVDRQEQDFLQQEKEFVQQSQPSLPAV